LADLEPLELWMPQIKGLVLAGSGMRGSERL
jgi:hypothetical protein